MATNINKQSLLNKSRVDKFILSFQLPNALKKIAKKDDRSTATIQENKFQFSIYGAVVPAINVPAIQIPYAGSNLYNSSHAKQPFEPVTVNFTVDNEFNNYWVIYKWLNLMHDQKTGLFDADQLISDDNFADYQTDMTIFGLDEFDNKRIEFTYKKAFPITLGGINYNYRESAEIDSSMTFVFSQLHTKLLNL